MFAQFNKSEVFVITGAGIQPTGPATGRGAIGLLVSDGFGPQYAGILVSGASVDIQIGGMTIIANTSTASVCCLPAAAIREQPDFRKHLQQHTDHSRSRPASESS